MNRFSKLILIALGGVLGLVVMSFVGANLYLQSSEVQSRIRNGVQQAVGAPLQIRSSSVTPWSGLTLSGLSIADGEIPDAHLFEADALNARLNWWELLRGRIEITSVVLSSPTIVVESGRPAFVLPSPRQEIPDIPVTETAPVPQPAPSPSLVPTPPTVLPTPTPQAKPLRIAVRHFGIQDGTFILKDKESRTQIEVTGIEMTTTIPSASEATGTLHAETILLARQLPIHNAQAEYTLKGDELDIPHITAIFAEGRLTGTAKSHLPTHQSSLVASLEKASVKALLEDADLPSDGASGDFGGHFELAGVLGDDSTYLGKGDFALVSGTLQPFEFIRKMGELFQIEELQLLELETARLQVAIANRRTQVQELILQSKNLVITGTGPIKFDGRLDLDARLKINPKLQKNLKMLGLLNKNFKPSPDLEGYKEVAFKVTGTLKHPSSDLLDKLTGIRLGNDLGNLLQGLFGPPKKK